jgi:hypothetical protein
VDSQNNSDDDAKDEDSTLVDMELEELTPTPQALPGVSAKAPVPVAAQPPSPPVTGDDEQTMLDLELEDMTPAPRSLPSAPTPREPRKVTLAQKPASEVQHHVPAPTPPELQFKFPPPKVEGVSVSKLDGYGIFIVVAAVIAIGSTYFIELSQREPTSVAPERSARMQLRISPYHAHLSPKVMLDGKPVSLGTDNVVYVSYGTPHTLEVQVDGFELHSQPLSYDVPAKANSDERPLYIELTPVQPFGMITVNSNPSCAVEIEREHLKWRLRTPVQQLKVPTGHYRVSFVDPANCPEKTYDVEITDRDKAIVSLEVAGGR